MTATTPKIVQIANAWAPADDDAGLDAVDLVFALDNAGRVWKANMHGGDPWYQIETFPTPGHIIQIAVASAPREGHVALERLFALCRDGSLWLKTMTVFGERAWVRVLEIPEQEIVQISVAWAPYDGSQGTLWAPLAESTDRLFALCRDGSVWEFHPFGIWKHDPAEALPPHWERLFDLPVDC